MKLKDFFMKYPKAAIAFSGGVDSSYLLYAAIQNGAQVKAYYVKSAFQPQFELDDALRFVHELNVPIKVLHVDILSSDFVANNPADRCYYCKQMILTTILNAATEDGFSVFLDGTNASDDAGDRPGMRALRELSVLSPLQQCGLTKTEIRRLSQQAGLSTWDKPAYACLATRFPCGETITKEGLKATEAAESYLFSIGLTNFRVRWMGKVAKMQISADQMGTLLENRECILTELKKYYSAVLLDLDARR